MSPTIPRLQPAVVCSVLTIAILACLAHASAAADSIQTLIARPATATGRRLPLCILLPGGSGRMPEASRVMEALGNPLAERGWMVVVPVSPDGKSFLGDAADHVVSVMTGFADDPEIRPGRALVVGVSNGGIAALQVAGMVPDRVSGVIAVPGLLNHWAKVGRLQHLPVYLRIGADDQLGWAEHYDGMVRKLKRAGVRLDAKLLEGVGHGFPMDWQEIDAWIARELGALAPAVKQETKVTLPASAARTRVWTSRSGETVEARLSEIREEQVILLREDGRSLVILRKHLSPEDQDYLQSLIETADGTEPTGR